MSIVSAFDKAFKLKKDKGWDYIYVLVDIHDTVFEACYHDQEEFHWFPRAKEALQTMSKRKDIKIIVWSSTYDYIFNELYLKEFERNGIDIDYFNENPECDNTDISNFSQKFYFNVGIDDKFGFDPNKDWYKIVKYFEIYD